MLRFKQGDQKAFGRLFDQYKRPIINYCFRYCGRHEVAEELAQETFLRVYKAAPRYQPEARFSTWLFKIATHVCLNEIRKPRYNIKIEPLDPPLDEDASPRHEIEAQPDGSMPDLLLERQQHQKAIRQAMDRLPDEQRAALLLRATEGFSYQQIGRQINRSENHVKTLIYRARQQMKKLLGCA